MQQVPSEALNTVDVFIEFSKAFDLISQRINTLSKPERQEFFLPDAPLEDLSQWHIHRFSPSSEDLSEKSQEGLDEAELIESPEGSKVILHCFDCDSEPQIWRSADGEQREKFFPKVDDYDI
ncbi:MAGUK p55 subfamily member 6 [Armadillidium vulgare]|nr:MAGUK p55 subfamily member 6 [Armadillidium vulgare]